MAAVARDSEPVPADAALRAGRRTAVLVWAVWAVMLLMAAGYVWRYGRNVPTWDDWDMVPALAGEQPVTWDWLWSQHNEHRVPLPRLIMLAVLRPLGAIDFRGGMYYNVATLAALSALLVVLARRLRPDGRSSLSDALLPIVLINWAQGLNLLWGWQVEFFTSTLLAGAVLALVIWAPRLTRARAVGAFTCLLLLGMCGAHGILMLPPMAVYFTVIGMSRWWGSRRDVAAMPERPRDPALLLCMAAVCAAFVGVYLVGWERVPFHPQSSGGRQQLATALQFLAMGFGPAVRAVPTGAMVGALVLAVATGLLLMATWVRRADERDRVAGMCCFLGAMAGLALAIGMGRDGFEPRYITLSVPAVAATYLAWVAYSPGGPTVRHTVPRLLLLVSLTCLIPNVRAAIDYGRQISWELRAFQEGLASGRPPHQLIARHSWWLHPHEDLVMDYLPMLRQAGVQPYANYRDDPPLREVRLPLTPPSVREAEWDATTQTLTVHRQPAVNFGLPEPLYVAGVRLKYRAANDPARLPYVPIYWREPGQLEIPRDQFHKYSPTGDRANWERGSYARLHDDATVVHAWLCRWIDAVRLEPEPAGGRFIIEELVLLVPVDGRPLP